MFEYDATVTLSHITVPALVIGGDQDKLCKPEASVFMSENIPASSLKILKPAGHMGPTERHEQMIEAIDNFARHTQEKVQNYL